MSFSEENLNALGYTDCFYQNGELWGFQNEGIMPQQIPTEILNATKQHEIGARPAVWPNFGRMQKLAFWCARTWHNLYVKVSSVVRQRKVVLVKYLCRMARL